MNDHRLRFSLDTVSDLPITLRPGSIVFLRGDLGAGKTTLAKHLLQSYLSANVQVKSPTYVYYNKYGNNVYHFDLYRLRSYDDFVNIGGEEILDNSENVCLIEWPEIIEARYVPELDIRLRKTGEEGVREIEIGVPKGT